MKILEVRVICVSDQASRKKILIVEPCNVSKAKKNDLMY